MGSLQKTLHYTAADMAFFAQHPKKEGVKDIVRYLSAQRKILSGSVTIKENRSYMLELFSTEYVISPAPAELQGCLFRIGIFMTGGNTVCYIADGLKPLGFILPKTFTVSAADLRGTGTYTFHAFSYPENCRDRLSVPFGVDLFLSFAEAPTSAGR